jgi:mRNA-degrading endonuclease toxin of MazEF toxin-antitoxin module
MNRGEVVEVIWYYSDMSGSKRRPAVVVQADFLNALIDDTILVQITSTQHGIPGPRSCSTRQWRRRPGLPARA